MYDTVGEAGTAGRSRCSPRRAVRDDRGRVAPAAPAGVSPAASSTRTRTRSAPQLAALAALLAARAPPLPDTAIYALEPVDDAFATSAAGHVVGKLVISIANFTR